VNSQLAIKPLELNPRADVREGRGPLRHHIAVPEPMFVQEMATVARERYGDELDRLPSQARLAIEEDVSDPLRWSSRLTYHAAGCPACADASFWGGAPTQ
jgi:hypothetical protein